jgi:hypothetical protein
MTVSKIGSNQSEIRFTNGVRILVSYQTPVAAYHPLDGYLRVSGESKVTTRHINKWVGGKTIGKVVSRKEIAELAQQPALGRKAKNTIRGEKTRIIKLN